MKTVSMLCVAVVCMAFLLGCDSKPPGAGSGDAEALANEQRARIEKIARFADEGPPPTTSGGKLRLAALRGNLDEVRSLISSGAAVNERDDGGNTAMHFAASGGNAAIVRVLIGAGARVDEQNDGLMTPLHMAVMHPVEEKHEAAYVLIANGADVDVKNIQGVTPVEMAGWGADKDLAGYMKRISKREPVTAESTAKLYALECASCHGSAGKGYIMGPPLKGTNFMLNSSDDEIAYVILYGRGAVYKKYPEISVAMPGFQRLGREEVKALVGHIRAFGIAGEDEDEDGAYGVPGDDEPPGDGGYQEEEDDTSYEEGDGGEEEGDGGEEEGDGGEEEPSVDSASEAQRQYSPADVIYASKCRMCHGVSGEGSVLAPPLKGTDFVKNSSNAEIVNVIASGRAGAEKKYPKFALAMPRFSELRSKEIADLAEYLRTLDKPDSPADVLYASKCKMCHGASGEGGPMAPPLRGADFVKNSSNAEVAKVITEGRSGAEKKHPKFTLPMPRFSNLRSTEVADLAEYLRTL